MTKVLYFLILINVLSELCICSKDQILELVHVIFRHGDRTPDKALLYPKDPHFNASYYPSDFGQLTNQGKQRQYLVGKALRKRYKNFLDPYTIETVDARSSDYSRTKVSLQLVLASLFPPEKEQVWNKDLQWQPIPATYWPYKTDHILGQPYRNCPRYKKIYWDFLSSPEGLKLHENYTEIMDYLAEHTGLNVTSKTMHELHVTLDLEFKNGLQLPNWTKSVYPDVLEELSFLEYYATSATPEMKRLSSGFLLKKIIQDTRKKIAKILPENKKIFLYSGHDYTMVNMLNLLGIFYPHVPPYSAYILLEIYNVRGTRIIKVNRLSDESTQKNEIAKMF